MKSYSSMNVAKCQASKANKFSAVKLIAVQDGEEFLVASEQEIADLIASREIAKKEAKALKKVAAKAEESVRKMTVSLHHETNLWIVGEIDSKQVWFEKASLKAFEVLADLKQVVLTASSKYFEKKFKSA